MYVHSYAEKAGYFFWWGGGGVGVGDFFAYHTCMNDHMLRRLDAAGNGSD